VPVFGGQSCILNIVLGLAKKSFSHPLVALVHHHRLMQSTNAISKQMVPIYIQSITYCPICCLWRALRPASWRFLIYVFLTAAGDPGMLIFYLNRLRYILTPPNRNNAIEIETESVDEIHVRCLRKLLIN